MSTRRTRIAVLAAVAAVATGAGTAAAASLPCGGEPVTLDPAQFTTDIRHPYLPMRVGGRWVYRETDTDGGRRRTVVTVTRRTRLIANGVRARVVIERVTEDGELVGETFNWYARDRAGNIWDLGEDNREYRNGKLIGTAGSFEAGVNGAQPSLKLPADLAVGTCFRAEVGDRAHVLSRDEQVEVPFRFFPRGQIVMIRESSVLEPKAAALKFFARGVGVVLAVDLAGGSDREELVGYRRRGISRTQHGRRTG